MRNAIFILKEGNWEAIMPHNLQSSYYIDFRKKEHFYMNYQMLIGTIKSLEDISSVYNEVACSKEYYDECATCVEDFEISPLQKIKDSVRFMSFFPSNASIEKWYSLLVYGYIDKVVDKVKKDAARFNDEMNFVSKESSETDLIELERGTNITIVPICTGVMFNPDYSNFKWYEDYYRSDFRFYVDKALINQVVKIQIFIYIGPLVAAVLQFPIYITEKETSELKIKDYLSVDEKMYKFESIFVSYSHKDKLIVEACRSVYKTLGLEVLIDIDNLRSGQKWNNELMRLIEKASIFQLFWSRNSSKSPFVRTEWEYALKNLKNEGFIRPVYWKKPLVHPPPELEELHFAYLPIESLTIDKHN